MRAFFAFRCLLVYLFCLPSVAWAHSGAYTPPGRLQTFLMWVGIGSLLLLEVALLLRYRSRRSKGDATGGVPAPSRLDAAWGAAPLVLLCLLVLVVWANSGKSTPDERTGTVGPVPIVRYAVPPPDGLQINVRARQFRWEFLYPTLSVETETELHVPLGQDITLHLHSMDVIHSFDIPSLAIRQDIVPGMDIVLSFRATEIGRHEIVCSALCGLKADEMPGMLQVDDLPAFQAWVRQKKLGKKSSPGMTKVEQISWSSRSPSPFNPPHGFIF